MAMRAAQSVQELTLSVQRLAERVDAELGFVRKLIALEPTSAKSLQSALAAAEKRAREVFAASDLAALQRGVSEIEQILAPAGKVAKQYTIYCVGHAHIDMNWMWGWPETVAVTNDTFTTVLKLMEEFPDFVFSQSQASVYALIQQYNPALFQAIAQRVKEGRWEVTASHWVEGDRNMVSGESLTRHLLYTRKYFSETLGLEPEDCRIDWSPDTFGHPLSVPMYLTRGGVKYVYLHRPGAMGPKRPEAFWWQSPDGSRVLVRNDMANGYNGQLNPGVVNALDGFAKATGLKFVMYVYGVGDHGGGPTRKDLAFAVEMDSWPIFPNIKFSRAIDFYTRLEKEGSKLPTLTCELNTEVAGCYTTQSLIKRCNRIAEHRLLDAETACTIASSALGRPYPAKDLELAWRDILFGHFHDILPGSNVHDSRTWMHGLFQKTMATTSMAETLALRELAGQVDTCGPDDAPAAPHALSNRNVLGAGVGWGSERHMANQATQATGPIKPIVLFNPTAWDRKEVVEATIWTDSMVGYVTDEIRGRSYSVRTPDGTLIPAQKLEHGGYWGHAFVRLAFPVKVPALGYATYTVLEESTDSVEAKAHQITPPHHCWYVVPDRRPEGLENDLLRLELDTLTGGIRSLVDKKTGRSLIASPGSALEYALEKPHAMTAWCIDNIVARENAKVVAIDRKQDGPYSASVDVRFKVHESEFTLTYELRADDPRLYLHLKGTWFERGTPQTGVPSLLFALPLDLNGARGRYEIPFGAIDRSANAGEELPALNFVAVQGKQAGKQAGILLLNDCKHGHSLSGSTLRLTLIRAAYDPDPLPEVGQHEVHLALMPFAGDLPAAEAIRMGKSLNRPLRLISTPVHGGRLPAVASALTTTGDGVVLTDLKTAEDGSGLVVHLSNPTTAAQSVTLKLNPDLLGKLAKVEEVDLMERPLARTTAKLRGNVITMRVPANAVAALKLVKA